MEKTIKLSDEEKFSVFHKIAARKREQNPDCKSEKNIEDELYTKDDQGREIINPDIHKRFLEKSNSKKAISEHGNDKNKRLDLCGFPRQDRSLMFEYDYRSVLNKFPGLDIKNSSWVYIYGHPGTGKTTLAMRLVWEWMKLEASRYSTFLSVRDWIQEQYNLFGKDNKNEIPDLSKFKRYVILDDFDKIHFTEWQMLQIFRLVDYLDRNNKKVIITSNHSISELLDKSNYDLNYKATLDRIAGRTKKAILGMDGKSFRNENFQL